MVVHDGGLHVAVANIAIVMAEEHDLVLVSEPVVGDGDLGGPSRHVEEPVLACIECVVVDPHLRCRHEPDGVAVYLAEGQDFGVRPDHLAWWLRLAVVDV